MGFRIGIDVGGTFTDVTALDEKTGRIYVTKTPSTPTDQSVGVGRALRRISNRVPLEEITHLFHGTTVATNAFLERKGAKTALVTTEGFRDILYIARQVRPHSYDFWAKRPEPFIPRYLTFEVPERVLHTGEIEKTLDEGKCRKILERMKEQQVEAIAVCFLHSYANPVNEKRFKEIASGGLPGVYLSLSSEVLPAYREYERASTTSINAYLTPCISSYVDKLVARVKDEFGISVNLLVMQSNGGVMSAKVTGEKSVHTLLSGPAGGAILGSFISDQTGVDNLITLDMGGTSTDVCLVSEGEPKFTTEGELGGFPISTPMIEMHSIGSGGGSIAWIDAGGGLAVGPESAGADPGPVCYGRGGKEPTVTDANIVLGYMDPSRFLGGEIKLYKKLAIDAISKRIAQKLDVGVEEAAEGVIDVVNSNMTGAIKVVSTEKGHDTRNYELVGFGGAGPAHAAALAMKLKMPGVIIVPYPANASALGMLLTDVKHDFVETYVFSDKQIDVPEFNQLYYEMTKKSVTLMETEGFTKGNIMFTTSVDMRYAGQAYELNVPFQYPVSDREGIKRIVDDFHKTHERAYGYSMKDEEVMFINHRLRTVGKVLFPRFKSAPLKGKSPDKASRGVRKVFAKGEFIMYSIYKRERLEPGNVIEGPAIVEEYASTTIVPPGVDAKIDGFRNIRIEAA